MVTLWGISEEAREALEAGEHVRLEAEGEHGDVVIGFEESMADSQMTCDWSTEDGWRRDDLGE